MNQEKIGKFIAELRKENNLTQEELAEKLHVNVKSVSRWENGNNLPDHSVLKEISNFFNISINELYEGRKIKKNRKVWQIIIFYVLVSFISMLVLPILGIGAPTFIITGIISPIAGLIKLIASLFGYDIPQINVELFGYSFNPFLSFLITIILGCLFFILGIIMWKLLLIYIKYISEKKKKLYINL